MDRVMFLAGRDVLRTPNYVEAFLFLSGIVQRETKHTRGRKSRHLLRGQSTHSCAFRRSRFIWPDCEQRDWHLLSRSFPYSALLSTVTKIKLCQITHDSSRQLWENITPETVTIKGSLAKT